jgi:hypothetical protein
LVREATSTAWTTATCAPTWTRGHRDDITGLILATVIGSLTADPSRPISLGSLRAARA